MADDARDMGKISQTLQVVAQGGWDSRNGKKLLKDFGGCHEIRLIESFEMSPHLIGMG